MNTYTLALVDDMLLATAPDGDNTLLNVRLADSLAQINHEDRDDTAGRVVYEKGVTLFSTVEEAEDAGADIVYSGTAQGWLQDAEGRMAYQAAARLPGGEG